MYASNHCSCTAAAIITLYKTYPTATSLIIWCDFSILRGSTIDNKIRTNITYEWPKLALGRCFTHGYSNAVCSKQIIHQNNNCSSKTHANLCKFISNQSKQYKLKKSNNCECFIHRIYGAEVVFIRCSMYSCKCLTLTCTWYTAGETSSYIAL